MKQNYKQSPAVGKITKAEFNKVMKNGKKTHMLDGYILDQHTGNHIGIRVLLNTEPFVPGGSVTGTILMKGVRTQKQYDTGQKSYTQVDAKFEMPKSEKKSDTFSKVESDEIVF